MSDKTKISWADATWNCIAGCSKVSAGCANCYAERMAHRLKAMGQEKYIVATKIQGGWSKQIVCDESALEIPLRWKNPRRIFVNSMSDTFHKDVPFDFIDKIFAVMALCPQHQFMVLTKRVERMVEYCVDNANTVRALKVMRSARELAKGKGAKLMNDAGVICWPLPNVVPGCTVENQENVKRIGHLIKIPAAKKFVSFEPLLSEIDAERVEIPDSGNSTCNPFVVEKGNYSFGYCGHIDHIIIGCESLGKKAGRPCKLEWVKSLIEQADAAGVKVFVKQLSINGKVSKDMNDWPVWARRQDEIAE